MTTERLYYSCRVQAERNDILTEAWERRLYAAAIYNAKMWGYKISAQQRKNEMMSNIKDRCNK